MTSHKSPRTSRRSEGFAKHSANKAFTTKSGAKITQQDAERLADEAEAGYDLTKARRVGRPSLAGQAGKSPRLNFRVRQDVYDRSVKRAQREGKSVSEIAREALERYVG